MEDFIRRDVIKGVVCAGILLVAADGIASITAGIDERINPYQAKGLPLTELGSTGV